MVNPFNFTTNADYVKLLQYVAEGTSAATFGVTPSSPVFVQAGLNPLFDFKKNVEGIEVRKLGTRTRTDYVKAFETAELTIKTMLTDMVLPKRFMNAPVAGGTAAESFTYTGSYKIIGVETWQNFKGCIPMSGKVSFTKRKEVIFEGKEFVANCMDPTQAANGGFTTPTFAPTIALAPWKHDEGGATPLTIAGTNYGEESSIFDVSWDIDYLDPAGNNQVIYAKVDKKTCGFTLASFKADMVLAIAAAALTKQTMTRVAKTAVSTFTATNLQFEDPSLQMDVGSSKSLVETLKGSLDDIAIS